MQIAEKIPRAKAAAWWKRRSLYIHILSSGVVARKKGEEKKSGGEPRGNEIITALESAAREADWKKVSLRSPFFRYTRGRQQRRRRRRPRKKVRRVIDNRQYAALSRPL